MIFDGNADTNNHFEYKLYQNAAPYVKHVIAINRFAFTAFRRMIEVR